jgi:hypothetical protein
MPMTKEHLEDLIRRARDDPFEVFDEVMAAMPEQLSRAAEAFAVIDHFYRQPRYIELWFEARAMSGQFRHYTEAVDLVPMVGQPSIPFKWALAKRLEERAERYGKEIVILYFGDEDLAGHTIEADIIGDMRGWSSAEFEVRRCGLTEEQARKYGVPESVEKKGYQWEALSDQDAGEIIRESVESHLDTELIEEAQAEAKSAAEEWIKRIAETWGPKK